jgi:hypothetical protein
MAEQDGGPGDLKRLAEELVKASTRAVWPAYVKAHFDGLTALIEEHGPHWGAIAKWAVREGHTNGAPLSGNNARKAYEREAARRAKVGQPKKKRAKAQSTVIRDGVVEIVREPIAKPDPAPTQDPSDVDAMLAKAADAMGFPWDPQPKPKKRTE